MTSMNRRNFLDVAWRLPIALLPLSLPALAPPPKVVPVKEPVLDDRCLCGEHPLGYPSQTPILAKGWGYLEDEQGGYQGCREWHSHTMCQRPIPNGFYRHSVVGVGDDDMSRGAE